MNVLAKDVTLVRETARQAATAADSAHNSAGAADRAVVEVNKIASSISALVNKALLDSFSATVQKNTGNEVKPVTLSGPHLITYLTESVTELLQLFATIKNQTAPDVAGLVSNTVNIVMEKLAPFVETMKAAQAASDEKLKGALATIEVLKKNQVALSKMFLAVQTVLGKNFGSAPYLQGMILSDATPAVVNVLRQKGDQWKSEISQLVELVGNDKDNLRAILSNLADKPHVLIAALASEEGIHTDEVESSYKAEMDMIQTRAAACFKALSPKESA